MQVHIFSDTEIIEILKKQQKGVYLALIYLTKAFDRATHSFLWSSLERKGINPIKSYVNVKSKCIPM